MEFSEQKAWVVWMRETYPEYLRSIRPSMNGLKRSGRREGARLWGMMKSQGSQKSEADIIFALPKGGYGALVIEHKGEDMSRTLDDDQIAYLEYHQGIGNYAVSTRGLSELKEATVKYLEL